MTFDQKFNLEFCFDCHENTCNGRTSIRDAMLGSTYRGGLSHTGATRCVCDLLLSERCGLDSHANCISVVYITDGKSNDPRLEICAPVPSCPIFFLANCKHKKSWDAWLVTRLLFLHEIYFSHGHLQIS